MTASPKFTPLIKLNSGYSGSSILKAALNHAAQGTNIEAAFKAGKKKESRGEMARRFEGLRCEMVSESESYEIAQKALSFMNQNIVVGENNIPLDQFIKQDVQPLELKEKRYESGTPYVPTLHDQGKAYQGEQIKTLTQKWLDEYRITPAAKESLDRMADKPTLDLSDEVFVVFGGAAELSPAPILLAAGAKVVIVDKADAVKYAAQHSHLNGALYYVDGGMDLLNQPAEILATLKQFLKGQNKKAHVLSLAYAPGAARELFLPAVSNTITDELIQDRLVESFGTYISPTAVAKIEAHDKAEADRRLSVSGRISAWFKRRFHSTIPYGEAHYTDATVEQQGGAYLTAQLVFKRLYAAVKSAQGVRSYGDIASITDTKSMKTWIFQKAFAGAFKVKDNIASTEETVAANGLMMISNMVHPKEVATTTQREKANAVFERQIHGGAYASPIKTGVLVTLALLWGIVTFKKGRQESL